MNCLFVENRGIGVSVIVLCHVAGTDATVSFTHASGVNWVEFGFGGVEWRNRAAPGGRGRSWWLHSDDSEIKLLRARRAGGPDVMAGGGATDGEGSS